MGKDVSLLMLDSGMKSSMYVFDARISVPEQLVHWRDVMQV